jgi:hypothetical protein
MTFQAVEYAIHHADTTIEPANDVLLLNQN